MLYISIHAVINNFNTIYNKSKPYIGGCSVKSERFQPFSTKHKKRDVIILYLHWYHMTELEFFMKFYKNVGCFWIITHLYIWYFLYHIQISSFCTMKDVYFILTIWILKGITRCLTTWNNVYQREPSIQNWKQYFIVRIPTLKYVVCIPSKSCFDSMFTIWFRNDEDLVYCG